MPTNVIPSATIGSPIALPSYGTLANTVASPTAQQLTVSAANAPIPFGYGRVRMGARVVNYLLNATGDLLLDCVIGEGTINALLGVDINDAAAPAGVTTTFYNGTQTTADSALVAAWALQGVAYADIRPGISYVVLKIPASLDLPIDERSITFEIEMRKVFDPRQNLLLRSEDFTVNNFLLGATVAQTAVLAPDFSAIASLLTSTVTGGSNTCLVDKTAAVSNNTLYAWSVFMKPGTSPKSTLNLWFSGGTFVQAVGEVTWGTTPSIVVTGGAGGSVAAANNGWYLVTVLCNSGNNNVANCRTYVRDQLTANVTGHTVFLFGGQLRLASSSSGYVKTVASAFNPVTQYSNNPALALADFLADAILGFGDTVDWNTVGIAAARCDELLNSKRRYTVSVVFDEQGDKGDVAEVLRGAAGCFIVREGGTTYLVPDATVDTSGSLSLAAADWQPETLRYSQRGQGSAPNRIVVRYTNTAVKPWAEAYTDPIETADVSAGNVDAVEMVVNATWITDHAEAIRLRNRFYNEHTLGLKSIEFEAFDKFYNARRGDVILISNGSDLVNKAVRITRMSALGMGRGKFFGQEYSAALFSDDTAATPDTPSSALPDPRTVVAVTGLTMVEEVYLDQSQAASIASGAKYLSRFRVTWTRSADRYLLDNVVKFAVGGTQIFEGPCVGTEYVSPPVQQGQVYTVSVQARNVLGFLATAVTASQTALGKLLKPGAVPSITQSLELGGEVLLAWNPSVDIDVIRYEWRYTPNVTGAGSWDSATLIDRIDGLRARFKGLPVGTHRFYVKPIDSVPQYSTAATYVDITVTSDANAFLQALEYVSPTLTNMIAFQLEGELFKRWITNHTESWNTLFTAAMSTYTNPLATYGTGNSTWIGETQDVGSLVTGNWSLDASVTDLSGTAAYAIQTSPDGSTWTDQAGITYTGAARYVRPKITTTGAMQINRPPKINLSAVTRKESGGPVTSSAGAATTITLAGRFVKAVRITVTPLGTVARMPTVDNVVLSLVGANSFDVYLFDAAGTQVASSFNWDMEGF